MSETSKSEKNLMKLNTFEEVHTKLLRDAKELSYDMNLN